MRKIGGLVLALLATRRFNYVDSTTLILTVQLLDRWAWSSPTPTIAFVVGTALSATIEALHRVAVPRS